MTYYYICDNCSFQFERISECEECPACGKYRVRFSTEGEEESYIQVKSDDD